MSKLFDTHAHLMDGAFEKDYDTVLSRTLASVGALLNVGCSFADADKAVKSAEASPQVFASVGLHPSDAKKFRESCWEHLVELAQHPRVRAIGETGLDYHWDSATPEEQKTLYRKHIELAKAVNKPLIIHDREAHRDCLDLLWEHGGDTVGGVFHAYSGSAEMMLEVVDHNYYIGIGGVVTFKNAKTIKKVAKEVPLDRLLLETDCPYMTPVPYRGKRNEPAYVQYVAEAIAELRGIPAEDVVNATWKNACRLYRIDPQSLAVLD